MSLYLLRNKKSVKGFNFYVDFKLGQAKKIEQNFTFPPYYTT